MAYQKTITYNTSGRGTYDITDDINQLIAKSGVDIGLCNVFIQHTSASLIITENADSAVRHDLETVLKRLAPDGDPEYRHDYEGDDDMSAHIRCMLTNDSLTIPISNGCAALGTWQGIYLYEHRTSRFSRSIVVTVMG
ncbi:secondary thiamine-phosphate synthase enzyme YjbQ [Leucothrix arctica]|uniref:Secondary thiamine-phosphate synthase n=1 Tax=Leucothrix arctica TaxID=1481894 RepID=A0A317C469_9GAMM|nr:secondary thiamine-phosphate synthase enzyme YjbQ [Leucothrix arctica]PWQ93404.1 secondary thiamine-phosphate synthase [Leucothrix arctica]